MAPLHLTMSSQSGNGGLQRVSAEKDTYKYSLCGLKQDILPIQRRVIAPHRHRSLTERPMNFSFLLPNVSAADNPSESVHVRWSHIVLIPQLTWAEGSKAAKWQGTFVVDAHPSEVWGHVTSVCRPGPGTFTTLRTKKSENRRSFCVWVDAGWRGI